jgi:nitrate reductase assembly molybdenum cofactor insertion protein NarJ
VTQKGHRALALLNRQHVLPKINIMKTKNNMLTGPYQLLAKLFVYPGNNYSAEVKNVQNYLDEHYKEAAETLLSFTNFVESSTLHTLEELFTRSFEVQAVTTLDLGYLLFGDDYKRAELLVNLNKEHNAVNNDCGNELSDHLPNVLRLLPILKDDELRIELVNLVVAPALMKMLDDFRPETLEKKNKVYLKHHKTLIDQPADYALIYHIPIKVVMSFVSSDFDIRLADHASKASGFLGALDQEMEIEKQ